VRTTEHESVYERYIDFFREYKQLCLTYRLAVEPAEGWTWAQVGEPADVEEMVEHLLALQNTLPRWTNKP
jgi:hypothetical protein